MTRKINILFVLPDFDTGGSEKLVVDLASSLDQERFSPVVCAFFSGVYEHTMRERGIPFYAVHDGGVRKSKFQIVRFLNQIVREHRIDIVNTHHTSALLQGLLSFKVFNRTVLIHTEHTRLDYDPHITPHVLRIQKVFMKFTDAALGISQGVCEYFRDELNVPPGKIVKILNGIDASKFQFEREEGLRIRAAYRKQLGIAEQDTVIGTFANFRTQKNHDMLIRAFALVSARHPSLRLVLAGDGPRRPAVEDMVRELGLESSVLFLGARSDIPQLMIMIDIYCLPSHFEGLPFSLIEAFAAGKQVVATNVDGSRDVIGELGQGVLVDPDNAPFMAEALEKVISGPGLGESGPGSPRLDVFAFDRMIRNYEELFLKYGTA